MVSFGGNHLMGRMIHNQKGNPLPEQYDRLLEICKKEEVLSHEETEGLYEKEEMEALAGQKEAAPEALCRSIYDALPKDWREQGKIKTAPTC